VVATTIRIKVEEPTIEQQTDSAVYAPAGSTPATETVFELRGFSAWYDSFRAVKDIDLDIGERRITAIIGPSGTGKSTLLRAFNRMNDLIEGAHVTGTVKYRGVDLYAPQVDPVEVRRRIGMVFQKPNPFPKSIYDNVGQAQVRRNIPVWRPATASVHRPRDRGPA